MILGLDTLAVTTAMRPFGGKPGGEIGTPRPRVEDVPLMTGTSRYIDDVRLPGMLYAKILRSSHAHADITLDLEAARLMPGVHAVLCGRDLVGVVKPWGDMTQDLLVADHLPFAVNRVLYEGQEIAAVVADTRYQAMDALEAIKVAYTPLEVLVDVERAILPGAPLLHENISYEYGEGNIFDRWRVRVGDIEQAEQDADIVVRQRFATNRQSGAALDPHGCVADYDAFTGTLTLYASTQSVFLLRDGLADALQIAKNRVRVVAPQVGAGFGAKLQVFPHDVIASLFSMRLGRPVHLVLSRGDIFRAGTTRNPQVHYAELFLRRDGTITGYRSYVIQDCGAMSFWGNQVVKLGGNVGILPYVIPNVQIDADIVHTNLAPGGALRGFGMPQVKWAKEQLVDIACAQLGLDPLEMRLHNVIKSSMCPIRTPMGQEVDSTSIHECLQKAADTIGWQAKRAAPVPNEGVGLCVSMKYTSCRLPSFDTDQSAIRLRLETDGTVTIFSSDVSHGQGHATMLAQIVADVLGVGFEKIKLAPPDTMTSPFGLGTYASRAAAVLGTACHMASGRLREKLVAIAAHVLEADPADLDTGGDKVFVRGMAGTGLYFETLAGIAAYHTHQLPPDFEPSLEASATYDTRTERQAPNGTGNLTVTYGGAAHAAHVRVDPSTGQITLLDYVMVHDSGTVINPLIVEGQHHGGFLLGLGMALGEEYVYDDQGHMLNASFADYRAPQAADMPELAHTFEIPAPSTAIPGGMKGAGESSVGPVPAAIGNALASATGVRFTMLPMTPDRVLLALREKQRQGLDMFRYPDDMPDFAGPRDHASWPKPTSPDDELRL